MKKFLLTMIVALCATASFAETIEDTWFEMFYQGAKANIPVGTSIRKSVKEHIIFIDMPLPISSSQSFDEAAGKKAVIEAIRKTADAEIFKNTDLIVVYNYITTDYKVHSIVISGRDF